MKYTLQFDIGYDEKHWNKDTFSEDRLIFYKKIMQQYSSYKSKLSDCEWIEFTNATPELAASLKEFGTSNQYTFLMGSGPDYTQEEIRTARFVPFFIEGKYNVGHDTNYIHLNDYKTILCDQCGRIDDHSVPDPYYIDKKAMGTYRDIYKANLGLLIFSERAMKLLWKDIKDFVIRGKVLVEKNGQILDDSKRKYYWIRPKFQIGPYCNSVVKKSCEACKQPTEIRMDFYKAGFLMNVHMVSSYNNIEAPIALVGNWCGEITEGSPYGRHQDVFISGWLHEKIRNLKLKGHVEADYIIHSVEEFDFESISGSEYKF